jgi:orotidine-5'-phosphate decarboxylase
VKEKIIIALDVSSREQAIRTVQELGDVVGMFKVGSQLFTAAGPQIVREVIDNGGKVFLDLKFHDIPNTVANAALEAAALGVSMLTVHATGGRGMMQATSDVLRQKFGARKPIVVAVTILTSLDTKGLFEIGMEMPVEEQVQRLAVLAEESGVDGVVCSPREIEYLRKFVGRDFKIVTPGIRLRDQSLDDQQRTATPQAALAAGADYIVIGRAVTADPDPRAAIQHLFE